MMKLTDCFEIQKSDNVPEGTAYTVRVFDKETIIVHTNYYPEFILSLKAHADK